MKAGLKLKKINQIKFFCGLIALAGILIFVASVNAQDPQTAEISTILDTATSQKITLMQTTATTAENNANAKVVAANSALTQKQQAAAAWTIPMPNSALLTNSINAKSKGVIGNGINDDTANIQALIDSTPSGGKIYFPAGTYLIAGTITITKAITLFGTPGTFFHSTLTAANGHAFLIGYKDNRKIVSNVSFNGIEFNGAGEETYPDILHFINTDSASVKNCKFKNVGYAAVVFDYSDNGLVDNCVFDDIFKTGEGYGVAIIDDSDTVYVQNSFFLTRGRHGVTTGYGTAEQADLKSKGKWSKNIHVLNNYFSGELVQAINAHPQTDGPYYAENNVILCPTNQTYNGTHYYPSGISMGSGNAGFFSMGSSFVQNNIIFNGMEAIDINLDMGSPANTHIVSGNMIINNLIDGDKQIYIGASNTNVNNNYIIANSGVWGGIVADVKDTDISNITIKNNYVKNAGDMILFLDKGKGRLSDVNISDNVLQSDGIKKNTGIGVIESNNVSINNNVIKNNNTKEGMNGIQILSASNVTVDGNLIMYPTTYSIKISDGNTINVKNNIFANPENVIINTGTTNLTLTNNKNIDLSQMSASGTSNLSNGIQAPVLTKPLYQMSRADLISYLFNLILYLIFTARFHF